MKAPRHSHHERGATIVEFALALLVFLMFLFGILDFSRMLFTWVAANEAARAGARYAAVCDDTAQQAKVLAHAGPAAPGQQHQCQLGSHRLHCGKLPKRDRRDHGTEIPMDLAHRGPGPASGHPHARLLQHAAPGSHAPGHQQQHGLLKLTRVPHHENRHHLSQHHPSSGDGPRAAEQSHQVQTFEGGKTRMPSIAEQHRPDLMIVDGMCCDPADLAPVEHVTTHQPHIAVILLCAQQTPEFLLQSMRAGVAKC
jgi:pilus assembly protein CpaE